MSSLVLRNSAYPSRIAQTSVRYARKAASADPRFEIIRRALYPSTLRNKVAPTGTWRPDIGRRLLRAIPSVQAHETIERAWLLHKRHVRRARLAESDRKLQCMHRAMEVLREVDLKQFHEANKEEDPRGRSPEEIEIGMTLRAPERRAMDSRIRGLFPREMRVPTDTPPRNGWNYRWTPLYPRV